MQVCFLFIYLGANRHYTNLTRASFCTNETHLDNLTHLAKMYSTPKTRHNYPGTPKVLRLSRDVRWPKFVGKGMERNAFPFKKDLSLSSFFFVFSLSWNGSFHSFQSFFRLVIPFFPILFQFFHLSTRDVHWPKFVGTKTERNASPFKKDLSLSSFFFVFSLSWNGSFHSFQSFFGLVIQFSPFFSSFSSFHLSKSVPCFFNGPKFPYLGTVF